MPFGDLSRINTNVQALRALGMLQHTNGQLSMRQNRLATGSRLNRAEDDPAGYTISKKLEARVRGQAQAIANVGDAKSMLTVGEGALNTTMDILQTMKEKVIQGANDSMGAEERAAIHSQLNALKDEVNDIFSETSFNGRKLFEEGGSSFTFQVNAESGDTFDVSISEMSSEDLDLASSTTSAKLSGLDAALADLAVSATTAFDADTSGTEFNVEVTGVSMSGSTIETVDLSINGTEVSGVSVELTGVSLGISGLSLDLSGASQAFAIGQKFSISYDNLALSVKDNSSASDALRTIDSAISRVSNELSNLGDSQKRLSFKQQSLQVAMTNNESARSRIADADFAKEQMEIVKLQILQQTGMAALAQANAAPQAVLSLL